MGDLSVRARITKEILSNYLNRYIHFFRGIVFTSSKLNLFREISTIFCDDSNILENRTRYCVEKVKLKMNRALYRRPIYTSKQLLFLGHGILNEITTRLFIKVFQTLIPVLI